jgi:four helix bundle protein
MDTSQAKKKIASYRDLIGWQRGKELAILIYHVTRKFPKSELFGLTNQLRRAAISIPSNLAEGFRRKGIKEKLNFLRIAFGSSAELETQLEISHALGFMSDEDYKKVLYEADVIARILNKNIFSMEQLENKQEVKR